MENYQEYTNQPLQNQRTGHTRLGNGWINRERRLKKLFGVSSNVAVHRLRKAILFKYIQKAEDNICFKCKKEIKLINELSIEHKIPWEGTENSATLFWDLDNIAFSHRKCNKAHRYKGWTWKRKIKKNMAWCSRCQDFKKRIEFYSNKPRWNGLSTYCINCIKFLRQQLRKIPSKKYKRIKKTCVTCNQYFYDILSRANRSKFHFCSKKCRNPLLWGMKRKRKVIIETISSTSPEERSLFKQL